MKIKKIILSVLVTIVSVTSVFALKVPPVSSGPVVDQANLLSPEQKLLLNSELLDISNRTGTQIAVLTIKSLEGISLESYSMKVAEQWKLGSAEKDDGVLLLVSLAEKKIRIEVGYGLEGDLTDTKCGLIIRNIMAPQFQAGRYGDGIIDAVRNIEAVIGVAGEEVDLSYLDEAVENNEMSPKDLFILILIVFFLFTGSLSQKIPGLSWLPWAFLFKSSGRHGGGGSYHGGGYHGGGGFHGGGGGFGGGGASGGW